jgi:Domain of unknown function (DUF4159)
MNGMASGMWLRDLRRGMLLLAVLCVVGAHPADAQRWRRSRPFPEKEPNFKEFNVPYDGRLTFTRFRYTPSEPGHGGGGFFGGVDYSWDHDYPRSDHHIMVIMRELTATSVQDSGSNIFSVNDPELFKFPIVYVSEPGFWTMTDHEAELLRSYLLKGGFMIVDDFVGDWDKRNLEAVMRRVLQENQLQLLDASHPIFHTFYDIDSLNFNHPYYGVPSYFYGLFENNDPTKRLLAIVDYNNDVSESWEWSGTGFIPIDLSNTAFKLGVNYFMYAMTH